MKYMIKLNKNIKELDSKIEILKVLQDAYETLRKDNKINEDMFFEQTATIDDILTDCKEDAVTDEDFAFRANEAVKEFYEICEKYDLDIEKP